MVKNKVGVTGAEVGLSGDAQIRIALQKIDSNGGVAQTSEIYAAIESQLSGENFQNKVRLVYEICINTDAVRADLFMSSLF
ncbi:hypothetical protein [Candidatus Villigracilis saccharophilus]|uniref:hypothetical protein n=1 Tax=Candidatus Villigracilis saccharophilus TaxID=3140684 RepID=UPI003134BA90|nr:hypothetical protein [Anaerolineales bacterium]